MKALQYCGVQEDFDIQPGTIDNTLQWLEKAGMSHDARIKCVTLLLDVSDISSETLRSEDFHRVHGINPPLEVCNDIGREIADGMIPIWEEKIKVLQEMSGVEIAYFRIGQDDLSTRKTDQKSMKNPWKDRPLSLFLDVPSLLEAACQYVKQTVSVWIHRDGSQFAFKRLQAMKKGSVLQLRGTLCQPSNKILEHFVKWKTIGLD